MRSRAENSPRRNLLDELRAKHRQRYDAIDGEHWGCICEDAEECMFIIVLGALTKSEQEVIRLLSDLKREFEAHKAEVRKLTSEIAGLETYSRRLKEENDVLRQEVGNGVPGPGSPVQRRTIQGDVIESSDSKTG